MKSVLPAFILAVILSVFCISALYFSHSFKHRNDSEQIYLRKHKRSVEALVREEVNKMDTSDLFLDVFITDEFNHYGGLEEFNSFDVGDATDDPEGPVAVAQSHAGHKFRPANRKMNMQTRFVRSIGDIVKKQTLVENQLDEKDLSKDTELMEKLKELARNSKNDNSFDTQKFTDLLKEYTATNLTNQNTVVTDKLVQILYNFLNEKKAGENSAPAVMPKKTKVVVPDCLTAPQILGRLQLVKFVQLTNKKSIIFFLKNFF